MRLKRLYIHGFKSFADKTEMTFEQGVTGVVGPNGCGKSNISDAVRWVLGEQSAKQLRGSKMEDVIFNGTEKRRRMAYCEVTLTFDNEDHTLPIDYTEVSVTRRVFRTGDSEYLINNQAARLKDIIDLFRDTGTGRDGYSIIGQGRVGEILSQKSEERRQVFEEAAGIVKYKSRKEEAEKRLDNTAQNLNRVNDIIAGLESRLEPLRLQSEDARKYLKLRDEQKDLELNSFILKTERYTERISDMKETVDGLKKELDESTQKQEELSNGREDAQQRLAEAETETAEKRDALQLLIRDTEAQEGTIGVITERIQAGKRDIDRINNDIEAAKQGKSGIESRINAIETEISSGQADKSVLDLRLKQREAELNKLERTSRELEEKSEDAKEKVIAAMNAIGDVRSEQARLTTLGQMIDTQLESLKTGSAQGEEEGKQLKRACEDAANVLEEENTRLAGLKQKVDELNEKTRRAGESFEKLSVNGQQLLSKKQSVSTRLQLLKELQSDLDGYNMSVKQVLKEAQRRGSSGVYGVVATIIHAPAKIEKALEMVLGGTLQHIVVEADEDARDMINYLKQNRYGRATFLPVSSIRGRSLDPSERRVLNMRGCLGVASEMVEYDGKFAGIVRYLLGRTLIAENIDCGIAIQRATNYQLRLVTLDGDVMNAGGSMTGGSAASKMSSLLSREREIKENSETLDKITKEIADIQASLTALNRSRAALKAERSEAYEDLRQQEIAVTRAEAHYTRAKDDVKAHEDRTLRVEETREELLRQKQNTEKELENLTLRKQTEESDNNELRRTAAALQAQLNEIRPKLALAYDDVSKQRVELTSVNEKLDARINERDRLLSQKGDGARVLENAQTEKQSAEERLARDSMSLEEEKKKLALFQKSLDEIRNAFNLADGRRLDVQEELKKINEASEELRLRFEEVSERSHRAEMLLQRVEGELTTLTQRIWEDYQLTYDGALEFKNPEFKIAEGEKRLNAVRAAIKSLGSVNVSAVEEYRETSEKYNELTKQREDLLKARDDLQSIIDELKTKMEKQFKAQFEQLDVYFRQTFTELFGGGRAELRLEDPDNSLESGIEIVAQPPGKKLQLLSLLSGGERALTAIAILFAMLKLKPTPFCILDEIEAALDDANIDNFADYLKTYSSKTQFVVVTHRKGTMTRCDALYGVAMEEKGVSKMMSVKLADAI